MLPKRYRLPKEKFQYIYSKGKKLRGKYGMLVYVKDSGTANPLLGIVVNKKIGNAVKRHRMTRLIRNIFTSVLKEKELDKSSILLQYIAFEFCSDYKLLEKELKDQIIKALS